MNALRHGTALLMLLALAGGIWTRHHYIPLSEASSAVAIQPSFENSGLQLAGTFSEPLGDLTGFQISFPDCPQPLAILPVPAAFMAIAPSEYRYNSDYSVLYIYNSVVHPKKFINYKLNLLNSFYRFQALFGIVEPRQFAYYFKIWIPPGCRPISEAEASLLERSLLSLPGKGPGAGRAQSS